MRVTLGGDAENTRLLRFHYHSLGPRFLEKDVLKPPPQWGPLVEVHE